MQTSETPTVTSKRVTSVIDETEIYAECIGDPTNPAIVYIHGNSTSSGVWDMQFFDRELLKQFYQIRFDLRGHGLSGTPNPKLETRFDDEQHASDIAAVLNAFSVQKTIFVGWSYGAIIPTDYMTVHGCKGVRGMVIASGLTGHEIKKFFTGGPYPGLTDNSDATKMHKAYGLFIRDLTHKPLSREWTLRLRGMMTEAETDTRQWIFKRGKSWEVYLNEASKTVPLLVIFGKQDRMNSTEFMEYIKPKWEPSLLTLKIIDGAGHLTFLEKHVEFNSLLLEWGKGLLNKS